MKRVFERGLFREAAWACAFAAVASATLWGAFRLGEDVFSARVPDVRAAFEARREACARELKRVWREALSELDAGGDPALFRGATLAACVVREPAGTRAPQIESETGDAAALRALLPRALARERERLSPDAPARFRPLLLAHVSEDGGAAGKIRHALFLVRRVGVSGEDGFSVRLLDVPALDRALSRSLRGVSPSAHVAFAAPRGPLKVEGGEIYEAYAPWRLPDPAREDLEGYPVRLSAAFYVAEGAPAASWKALIFPAGIAAFFVFAYALWRRRALRRRRFFVEALSHELRAPLLRERLLLDAFEETPESDAGTRRRLLRELAENRATIRRVAENAGRIARFGRAPAGGARRERLSVGELAERVCARARERLAESGVRARLRVEPELRERRVRADAEAIGQILFNLADNAAKYAPGAAAEIEFSRRGNALEIRFADDGPGLPAEARARIFSEFVRGGDVPAETPGSGMGLAVARRLAREQGGELVAEDSCSAGAAFRLRIPLRRFL
ncbi:MAG: ATP-binding protein [Candidatus Spyradosoma sp.]